MYILNKLKSPFFIIFWLMILTISSWASQIDDMYKDLTLLDRTNQIGRKSYTTIGDKFYKLYADSVIQHLCIKFSCVVNILKKIA